MTMMGSIPIPNTRFYLTSIDGKKWFITEYYRTAPFNPDKETYDLYKAFAEAFQENEREEREFSENSKSSEKSLRKRLKRGTTQPSAGSVKPKRRQTGT